MKTEGSSLLVCETMDVGGAVVVVTRAPLLLLFHWQQKSVSYGNILPVCSKGTLDKMKRVFFFFFFMQVGTRGHALWSEDVMEVDDVLVLMREQEVTGQLTLKR